MSCLLYQPDGEFLGQMFDILGGSLFNLQKTLYTTKMSGELDYGDYVVIIYASLQTCGILSTSFYVLLKSSSSGCYQRLKEIWSYKWIYASTLSTMYDQGTDIGVLIYWYSLIGDKDVKNVDMTLLFVLSCVFCGLSRLFNIGWGSAFVKSPLLGIFLGAFDLLIMAFVWGKVTGASNNMFNIGLLMTQNEDELSHISSLQIGEVLIESLPQILLQSLFLIRTFGNENIYNVKNEFNIFLVWISLFISLISATNKISHLSMTSGDVSQRNKFENKYKFRNECPIVNIGVLSQKIFFISTIVTRLFIYSLLWSVCGGMFLTLFIIVCFIVFVICIKYDIYDKKDVGVDDEDEQLWLTCVAGFIISDAFGFVSYAHSNDDDNDSKKSSRLKRFSIHNILNFLGLLLIFYFAFDNSFDCDYKLCSDKDIRSFNSNGFVLILFITVFCTSLLEIILFVSISTLKRLSKQWEDNYQSRKKTTVSNPK